MKLLRFRRPRSRRPRVIGRRLEEQARLFRAISWEFDASRRSFTYVSPWAEQLFGYPLEDWFQPDFWLNHLHPDDRPWAADFCVESTVRGSDHELEYRFLAADGRVLWVRDVVRVLERPEGPALAGLMIDVTGFRREEARARSRTLERLRRRKELVRLATLQHPSRRAAWRRLIEEDARVLCLERVGVWTFTADGSSIVCRDSFSRGGHSRGVTLSAQEYPAYFKALELSRGLASSDALADPRTAELTKDYLQPFGVSSMLDVPIRRGGKTVGILCHEHSGPPRQWTPADEEFAAAVADLIALAWDSAELKVGSEKVRKLNGVLEGRVALRTAELEAANEELQAFSWSLAHDLRAPLRHMNGYAKSILKEVGSILDPTHARHLSRIAAEAIHMDLLIEGLLSLSYASQVGLHRTRVEPETMVRGVLESLRAETSSRWVQVNIGPLPACRADMKLLLQVWANLLSNALKFTRGRDPAVIEVGSLPGGVYFVKDNGLGFEMRHAARLFKVFERLFIAHELEGTGAGLAIVKRIIDRHGGRIWAESEPGKGAAFYFTIEPGH